MKKEELQAQALELSKYIDEKPGGYYPDHWTGRAWSVNVKIHGRQPQASDLIAKMPRRYHKALLEHFDDETVQHIWDGWIENEAEYLLDIVKTGGAICDDDEKSAFRDAFGAIDVQRGHKWTRAGQQRWINPGKGFAADIRAILALDGLKPSDAERFADALKNKKAIFASFELWRPYTETRAGFYGRSGGHFCWRMANEAGVLDQLQAVIEWPDDLELEEAATCVADGVQMRKRIEYVTAWIKKAHKALDFGAELQYRIDEQIQELKDDEKQRRRERRDLALKAKSGAVAGVTVVDCLQHQKESIRRNAAGIIKEL